MNDLFVDRTDGTGRPVVLLHGVYLDHRVWDDVRAGLPGRTVLALDMPGHGRSRPLNRSDDIERVADAVAEAVRGAAIDHAIWVGHSWGGWVLARLATRAPDLVAGAVYTNAAGRRASGGQRAGFVAQRGMLRLGMPTGAYGRLAGKSMYDEPTREQRPELVDAMGRTTSGMGRSQVARTIGNVILGTPDSIEAIAVTPVPYRVTAGEHDYVLSDEYASRFASVLHRARGGHITPREDPELIVALIAEVEAEL